MPVTSMPNDFSTIRHRTVVEFAGARHDAEAAICWLKGGIAMLHPAENPSRNYCREPAGHEFDLARRNQGEGSSGQVLEVAPRRQRKIHASVRSTIYRFGSTAKPVAVSERLTISTLQVPVSRRRPAARSPWQPPSAKILMMNGTSPVFALWRTSAASKLTKQLLLPHRPNALTLP